MNTAIVALEARIASMTDDLPGMVAGAERRRDQWMVKALLRIQTRLQQARLGCMELLEGQEISVPFSDPGWRA